MKPLKTQQQLKTVFSIAASDEAAPMQNNQTKRPAVISQLTYHNSFLQTLQKPELIQDGIITPLALFQIAKSPLSIQEFYAQEQSVDLSNLNITTFSGFEQIQAKFDKLDLSDNIIRLDQLLNLQIRSLDLSCTQTSTSVLTQFIKERLNIGPRTPQGQNQVDLQQDYFDNNKAEKKQVVEEIAEKSMSDEPSPRLDDVEKPKQKKLSVLEEIPQKNNVSSQLDVDDTVSEDLTLDAPAVQLHDKVTERVIASQIQDPVARTIHEELERHIHGDLLNNSRRGERAPEVNEQAAEGNKEKSALEPQALNVDQPRPDQMPQKYSIIEQHSESATRPLTDGNRPLTDGNFYAAPEEVFMNESCSALVKNDDKDHKLVEKQKFTSFARGMEADSQVEPRQIQMVPEAQPDVFKMAEELSDGVSIQSDPEIVGEKPPSSRTERLADVASAHMRGQRMQQLRQQSALLSALQQLDLSGNELSELPALAVVCGMFTQLKALRIRGSRFTATQSKLAVRGVTYLDISASAVGGDQIGALANVFPNVEQLLVQGCDITFADAVALRGFRELQLLDLSNTPLVEKEVLTKLLLEIRLQQLQKVEAKGQKLPSPAVLDLIFDADYRLAKEGPYHVAIHMRQAITPLGMRIPCSSLSAELLKTGLRQYTKRFEKFTPQLLKRAGADRARTICGQDDSYMRWVKVAMKEYTGVEAIEVVLREQIIVQERIKMKKMKIQKPVMQDHTYLTGINTEDEEIRDIFSEQIFNQLNFDIEPGAVTEEELLTHAIDYSQISSMLPSAKKSTMKELYKTMADLLAHPGRDDTRIQDDEMLRCLFDKM